MEIIELTFYEKIIKIQSLLKVPKDKWDITKLKYKYRSCESILEEIKPLLAEYWLILILSDSIVSESWKNYIKATALISDWIQEIKSEALAREDTESKFMSAPQLTWSSSSYARKYALWGLLLLDDSKDPDVIADELSKVEWVWKTNDVQDVSFWIPVFTDLEFLNLVRIIKDKWVDEAKKTYLALKETHEIPDKMFNEIKELFVKHTNNVK